MQVAVLGLLRGPTVPCGLVAEAAAEAWGTRATLTHTPTAWTIVTETMDTAAVCREEEGAGKLRQGESWLGAEMQPGQRWAWGGQRGFDFRGTKSGVVPDSIGRRRNERGTFAAFSHPILAALSPNPPSGSSPVCLT